MSETWTYFDANTIQIAGDSSAYYWPNMLLKITQSTEKFFVVLAVAVVGGNTRLTISGGGVYTLTNAAITVHAATKNAGEQGIPSGFLEQGLAYGAATKSTPDDADRISLWDSAANFVQKGLTWANLKATLKTYFDTIYSLTGHGHTSLSEIDTRSTNPTPQSYSKGERFDFKYNTADGLADGGTYHGVMTYRRWGDWSGGGVSQLAFTDNGNLWIRYANADDTWGSWKLVSLQSLATAQNDFLVGSGAGAFVKKTLAEVKTILGLGSAAYTPATAYVTHALATAANDFLVASESGVFVKKTLAEVKTILGLGSAAYTASSAYVAHSLATAANDFLVASGSGVFVKKTLAEVKTILGLGSAAYTASTDYASATFIGASVSRSTSQSVVTGYINVTLICNTISYDTHSAYSTSTGGYTVPVAGYYEVSIFVNFSDLSVSTGELLLFAVKNSAAQRIARDAVYSVYQGINGKFIFSCAVGDVLGGAVAHNNGATRNTEAYFMVMQIHRVK